MAISRNLAKTGQAGEKSHAPTSALLNREWTRKLFGPLNSRPGVTDSQFLLTLETLDHLGIGFVVCNHSGQVLVANRSAEEKIRRKDGLQLNSRGELCGRRKDHLSEHPRLRAARIAPSREFGYGNAALSIKRTSGEKPLTVVVRSISSNFRSAAEPAALLLVFDSTLPARISAPELKQLYGMTATESRLAILLTDGKSLDDCCRELGMARPTACTHLRRVFKKTRVRRQGELVALLLKSIGLARLGSAASGSLLSSQLPEYFRNSEANFEASQAPWIAIS